MFSSKYGKCQSGSISATPSAEMNRVETTFAIAVVPSSQVMSIGRPPQHPKLIGRPPTFPPESRVPEFRAATLPADAGVLDGRVRLGFRRRAVAPPGPP